MQVLAGDVGGTNIRLALVEDGRVTRQEKFSSAGSGGLDHALDSFLGSVPHKPATACLGVAGPVQGDVCRVTNLPWVVDGKALEKRLGIRRVRVINDFHAAALGVTVLEPGQRVQLGGGVPIPTAPMAILGAGTGLGVALLVHDGTRHIPVPGEGGHREFAPRNALQQRLLAFMLRRYPHVSLERVCSGMGLPDLYAFVRSEEPGLAQPTTDALLSSGDAGATITSLALGGTDPLCLQATQLLVDILAAEAGNLALQVVAAGGVFIAGGIPPRLRVLVEKPSFRAIFEDKGRLSHAIKDVPAYLVLEDNLGLLGAAEEARRVA